jgi:putative chitinase
MSRILDFSGIDRLSEHSLSDMLATTHVTAKKYVNWLNEYCARYEINTPLRLAAFLAQIGHESCRLCFSEEIALGDAYEGRKDLGNIHKGDGKKYKGRGLIQVTGRYNYEAISKDLGIDFVNNPRLLALPEYAVWSACWFWDKHNLNALADEGRFRDITRKINGGYNGLEDREKLYARCKRMLNV